MPTHSHKESFSVQLMQFTDAALIWLAFWIASLLREPMFDIVRAVVLRVFDHPMFKDNIGGLSDITWLLFIFVPFTPLVLEMFNFYENPLQRSFAKTLPRVFKSYGVMILVMLLFAVFFKQPTSSRLMLGMAISLSIVFVLLRDGAMAQYSKRRAEQGFGRENIAFVGKPDDIRDFRAGLPAESTAFWNVVGEFDLMTGDWDAFQRMLNEQAVARVIFAVSHAEFDQVSQAIEICEIQGVEAWIATGFIRTQIARPTFDSLGSHPMLVLRSTPELSWALFAKGVIDRFGAFGLIVATSPFWGIAAVGIKLSDPGPVFYRQMRGGRYGMPYRMWKFRTMIVDAESKLDEVKEQVGNQMSGPVFKLDDDPRIFKFGRWLRKTSIDELPQLINVLQGTMSLVGPRPLPVYEVEAIEKSEHRRRMSVKPGITCLWQVSGRNEITDFDDWVKLDLEYIDNWSLWTDFKILLKTVPCILFGWGAR